MEEIKSDKQLWFNHSPNVAEPMPLFHERYIFERVFQKQCVVLDSWRLGAHVQNISLQQEYTNLNGEYSTLVLLHV